MAGTIQKVVGAAILLAAAAGLVYTYAPVDDIVEWGKSNLNNLEDVLLEAGIYGPIIIFCIYMVTTVFMLPLWGFHMTCGYVYGTFWAALLIATTQALCSGVAFSTSRYFVGPYIRGWLQKTYGKKFNAIDRAVGEDGLKIVLLLRLSPIIPFGINNYLCGCTGIKLWEFVLGTWLGVLPGTTAYCNMGSMGKQVLAQGTTPLQKGVMAIGLVAALLVIKLLSDLATKALKDAGIGEEEENLKKD